MTNQHPITPPPELVVEWADTIYQQTECDDQRDLYVATQAARWGADQELDACCELTRDNDGYDAALGLRAARRPKPPSLKEQALDRCNDYIDPDGIIRRALEQLP
jgi:hypothetical protein